jgi:hypothetical protein
MNPRNTRAVHELFLLNLVLQVFDGVATYFGIVTPWQEANPFVSRVMAEVGIGAGLFLCKAGACAALLMLRALAGHPLITEALAGLAVAYGCLSFIPWTARNLMLL